MLKPLVCIACEKVIYDRPAGTPDSESGVVSLISLFSKLIVFRPKDDAEPLHSNAAVPKDWTLFSMWSVEEGDDKREYHICAQISYPDDSPFGDVHRLKLNVSGLKGRTQVAINYNAFPVGKTGHYRVRTWLELDKQQVEGPIDVLIEVVHETPQK